MAHITPRVDIAFKKIFGVEENKDLLIALINSIVSEDDQVADITLLNPYNAKNFKQDKLSILDIKAQGIDGTRFNIEIQICDEADYPKRALYSSEVLRLRPSFFASSWIFKMPSKTCSGLGGQPGM